MMAPAHPATMLTVERLVMGPGTSSGESRRKRKRRDEPMNARWLRVGTGVVDLLAGAMAVAGSVGLVGGGIQFPLDWLGGTPFSDYMGPGLILGIAVGGCALAAGVTTLLAGRDAAALATAAAGCVTLGWIAGEYVLVGAVSWMQPVTLVYSLVMIGLAGALAMTGAHHSRIPHSWTRHAA
jgi:hypothetical protein